MQDDNLINLTNEIREINHLKRKIAASMLTRALFECCLVYKVKKANKWTEVLNLNPRNPGADPGLADLIRFCGNVANGVFAEQNICRTLKSNTTRDAKDYLDAMVHRRYREADSQQLETVANNLRGVISYVLQGH